MSYECFELEVANGIAHIRLNRPEKANSMTPSFWTELPAAVNTLSREASARVLVISAVGKHFSSGMDISVFTDGGLDGPAGTNPSIGLVKFLEGQRKCLGSRISVEREWDFQFFSKTKTCHERPSQSPDFD